MKQRFVRKGDMMHRRTESFIYAMIVISVAAGCRVPLTQSANRPLSYDIPPQRTTRRVPNPGRPIEEAGNAKKSTGKEGVPRKQPESPPGNDSGPKFPGNSESVTKLTLSVSAPRSVQLGGAALFNAVVRNDGTSTVRSASILARFDETLQFPGHRERIISRPIDDLPPGKSQTIAVSLTAMQIGSGCTAFSMKIEGRETVWKNVCVDVVPRQFNVDVSLAPLRTVGGRSEFTVQLENITKQDLRGVSVEVRFDPRLLKPIDGTQGARIENGKMTWSVNRLRPGVSVYLQGDMECLAVSQQACLQVNAVAADVPEDHHLACTEIVKTGQPFDMRIADTNDVIRVGDRTDVVVSVQNRSGKTATLPELNLTLPDGFEVVSTSVWEGRQALITKANVQPTMLSFPTVPMVISGSSLTYRVRVKAVKPVNAEFRATIRQDEKTQLELREVVTVIR